MPRELLHVWLMPWALFPESVEFGSIRIWDFYKEGPARITDSQEMLWLTQLMSCFKDRTGRELTNVAVVQHGTEAFERQGADGNYKVRWAGSAIAFCYLIGIIQNMVLGKTRFDHPGESECFQLMGFAIDEDGMLYYTEARTTGTTALSDKHVSFNEPPHISGRHSAPDRLLMTALARVNDTQQGSDLWNQLGVCFEWFSSTWSSAPEFSIPARFVALMTAFESLARQDINDRAPAMAEYASTLCDWTSLPTTEQIRRGNATIDANKPMRFIVDFGGYRNSFVHGSRLPHGFIKYCVADKQFGPLEVMSLIIHAMVANLLLQAEFLHDWEPDIQRHDLKQLVEAMHWDTNEPIQPSPHLSL